ncbi:MAG: DegT/DnrJ/EryC1/StrS family aminotransferase [Acidimicrobiales bacterium]
MNASPARLEPIDGNDADMVPFYALWPQHEPLLTQFRQQLDGVVEANAFVGGQWLDHFERRWADYCGVAHAIGVANGTDAIELILRGLGIGPGDEVVVPANTFVATPAAVVAAGATPVFVDVDPGTLLITEHNVQAAIRPATAAVIVVHLYGQVADVDAIIAVASGHRIAIIEDAAQAHGATADGRRAGSLARAAAFSFYPGKNLGALGDGGIVTTDDPVLAQRVRSLSNHGRGLVATEHIEVGRNSKLDGLQAAFLDTKLPDLDRFNRRRRELVALYRSRLSDAPLSLTQIRPGTEPAHHVMVAQVDARDWFRRRLADRGIQTSIHYPVPCHRQPAYERFGPGYLPTVERAAARLVSLPLFPTMSNEQVHRVCDAITAVIEEDNR